MFTVLIAKKEYINAIEQDNALFLEPFLNNKELCFCEWNTEGQSLEETVPGLLDAVGRRKNWRAVILNPVSDEKLKKQNPFDIVDYSLVNNLQKPPYRPIDNNWEVWERSWRKYYEELAPLKENLYRTALKLPLQRLSTWLCFRPADYVLNYKADTGEVASDSNQFISESDDASDIGEYFEYQIEGGFKPIQQLESLEKGQYEKDLRYKESLRRDFSNEKSINIAYPSEVICISERLTENGFFNPDSIWNADDTSEYSAFADRNMYFDKMRFLVCDMLPKTHKDYRYNLIRFLFTTLLISTNDIPGSVFQPRKLYVLDVESDDTPLCVIASSYEKKLQETYDVVEAEIEHLKSEIPGELSDREAVSLYCTPSDVSVSSNGEVDEESLFIEQKFGISGDCPEDEINVWNSEFYGVEKELSNIAKQQQRIVRRIVEKLRISDDVSGENICRLNSFQLEEIKDNTEAAEDRMINIIPPDIQNSSKYSEQINEAGNEVKKVMKERMSRKMTVASGLICILLNLFCLIPIVLRNALGNGSWAVCGIIILSYILVLVLILVIVILSLRSKVVKVTEDFNAVISGILSDIRLTIKKYADYLGSVCDVRRGYAVSYYAERNVDEYTRRLRIRKKHLSDIKMKQAELNEMYSDFIKDSSYYNKSMISSYEYDFDLKKEYSYPAPFFAGDSCQIEFFMAGNNVTVPASFITSISARLEEIYES